MAQPGGAGPEQNRAVAGAARAVGDSLHGRLSPRSEALALLRNAQRIFIAYSHSDLRTAHRFRKRLVRLRRDRNPDTVFLDQDSLQPGTNVSPTDIDRRLEEADLFVVLCGKDTAGSEHVAHEIRTAMARRDAGALTVLPIILGRRARLPAALDFRVQAIFLSTLFPGILLARVLVGLLIVLLAVSGGIALHLRQQREMREREART